ncbi:MAG: SpoIIE family protein phosphatase [Chthoniobacterales bacterium]
MHGGPGLCIFENAPYGTVEASLDNDDVILLFTDGLIAGLHVVLHAADIASNGSRNGAGVSEIATVAR